MWTVQEVIFPSTDKIDVRCGDLVVRCGDLVVPWLHVVAAVDILNTIKYRWGSVSAAMSLQIISP